MHLRREGRSSGGIGSRIVDSSDIKIVRIYVGLRSAVVALHFLHNPRGSSFFKIRLSQKHHPIVLSLPLTVRPQSRQSFLLLNVPMGLITRYTFYLLCVSLLLLLTSARDAIPPHSNICACIG